MKTVLYNNTFPKWLGGLIQNTVNGPEQTQTLFLHETLKKLGNWAYKTLQNFDLFCFRLVLFKNVHLNARFDQKIFANYSASNRLLCAIRCAQIPECLAYNFCGNKLCELINDPAPLINASLILYHPDCDYVGLEYNNIKAECHVDVQDPDREWYFTASPNFLGTPNANFYGSFWGLSHYSPHEITAHHYCIITMMGGYRLSDH